MAGLHPVFKVKKLFIDQKKLVDKMRLRKRAALMRVGGRVRKTAQFSMKPGGKAGKSASPGQPPRTHKRKGIKRFLYFTYDEKTGTVVVGPVLLNDSTTTSLPKLLEVGGDRQVEGGVRTVRRKAGRNNRGQFVKDSISEEFVPGHIAKYHAFPYMGPAMGANVSFLLTEFQKGGIL